MRKLILALVVTLVAAAAACGQRTGIHQRFTVVYTQPVAESTTAHGASAKTRDAAPAKHIPLHAQRVPGGRRILLVRVTTTTANVTWPQWAALLLDRLGAPRCANNLIVMVAWAAQENTEAGWNPLATTLDMPGNTLFNSAGVKNYPSLQDGLVATVLTLKNGWQEHGYGAIVQNLRACADPLATAAAINASDWCHGCAGGAYVIGVVPKVIASYVASLKRNS